MLSGRLDAVPPLVVGDWIGQSFSAVTLVKVFVDSEEDSRYRTLSSEKGPASIVGSFVG